MTLDTAQPRLSHAAVPALYLKRERRDEGEFVRFAAGGWKIEAHTVDSAVDLLLRRTAPELHAIFIDASAFAGKETQIAAFVRMRVVMGLPLILVRHGSGAPVDTELFLTRIDHVADPVTLRQVAHLVECLQKARNTSPDRSDRGVACNILIADDNMTNQRTARLVLESAGHRVTAVNDGEQALDALERDAYDLAFMDMHMPNMTGIDAAKLYQFIQPVEQTPIVILTADATDDARNLAESARVAAYLTKPIRADELLDAVKKYARHSTPRQSAPDVRTQETDPKVVSLADALVDPSELRQLLALCGNPDEIAQLIEEFIADTRVQLRRAHELYEAQQWSGARDLMHAMKGASRTVGAVAIAKRVAQLEKASIEDLRERGQLDIAELRGIVDRTRTALRETIARHQDNRRAQADPRK
jgi:two-component system sensor histidine kinase RpfC